MIYTTNVRRFVSNYNSEYKQYMIELDKITGLTFEQHSMCEDRLIKYLNSLIGKLMSEKNEIMINNIISFIELHRNK